MHVHKFVEHFDTIYTFEPDPLNFFLFSQQLAIFKCYKNTRLFK